MTNRIFIRKYIFIFFFINISLSADAQIKWNSINSPTGKSLKNLVFTDNLNGWAVGDSGTIIHTSDGGLNWVIQNTAISNDLFSATFPDKNHGWALSIDDNYNSIILNTTNGGNDWSNSLFNGSDVLSTILFLDSLNGWAGGYNGSILYTSNGGKNWNNAGIDTLSGIPIYNFLAVNKNYGFSCGGRFDRTGVIWKTTDGGRNWSGKSIAIDPVQSLFAIDSLNIEGIGGDFEFGAALVKTTDAGLSWNYTKLKFYGIGLNLSARTKTERWAPINGGITGRLIYTRNSGITWKEFALPDNLFATDVKFIDSTHGIAVGLNGKIFRYTPANLEDNYTVSVNRFSIPINNSGVIADINGGGGKYDSDILINSAGFYMSGLTNGILWANASAYGSGIQDYQPGIAGSAPNDPNNKVYIVKSSDPPFSASWQNWKNAVTLGADFYDGNNDGIYNPVDLNGNGKWDPGEDRPDILGDLTTWCVYNDGIPSSSRKFSDVTPQGIEIQQTLFVVKDSADLQNSFFIRYRVFNRGTVSDVIDSVYFGIWSDPDIGEPINDLLGCDTVLESGYAYNAGTDLIFGENPPSLFVSYLQGPAVYIPGVTYIDNNKNGVFDEGIDTPLDTAWNFRGSFLGKFQNRGAKNIRPSSLIQFQNNNPGLTDPSSKFDARNFMTGKTKSGIIADPCNWPLGTVKGSIDCSQINNSFWYSGDPISQTGWLNNSSSDQRMLFNTGPFELRKNKPIDIIVSYLAGRGIDPLNSISVARNINSSIKNFYNQNFPVPILNAVNEKIPDQIKFNLFQNYPNPFNPITSIKYSIPKDGPVKLTIYNIIGSKVATIIDEYKQSGNYSVQFNGSRLASGIYFYRLESGGYSTSKKLILLK
jgi:photosystem II stability/assembly factor-like uncharacterized protein